MAYPTTLPSYTITAGSETMNTAGGGTGISGLLNAFEADIVALGTKVGTGATTPAANTILYGTGAGTSAWQGLTSAQLASILSDETGSGSAVFANSPTIATPTISSPVLSGTTTGTYTLGGTPTITSPVINQFSTASGLGAGWSTWSPTWTNLTVGNGTTTAKYIQIGKTIIGYLRFVLGSTSSVGTNPFCTIPATASSSTYDSAKNNIIGQAHFDDAGVQNFNGIVLLSASLAVMTPFANNATGTYNYVGSLTAAVPFAWGTGDYISMNFTYEAA